MSFTEHAANSANSETSNDAGKQQQTAEEMTNVRNLRRTADDGSVNMPSRFAFDPFQTAAGASLTPFNEQQGSQSSSLSHQSPPLNIKWTPVSAVDGSHMTVSQHRQQQRATKQFPSVLLHSPSTQQGVNKLNAGANVVQMNSGVSILNSQYIPAPLVRSLSSSSSELSSSSQTLSPSFPPHFTPDSVAHLGRPVLPSRPYSHSSVALPAINSSSISGIPLPEQILPYHSTAFPTFSSTSPSHPNVADDTATTATTTTTTSHAQQPQSQFAFSHTSAAKFTAPFEPSYPTSATFSLQGGLTSHAMEHSFSNLSSPLPRGHAPTVQPFAVGGTNAFATSKLPSSSTQSAFSMSFKPASTTNRRVSAACNFCQVRKLRCDGQSPCRQCARRSLACVFSEAAETRKRRRRAATVTGSGRAETVANVGLALPPSTLFTGPRATTFVRGGGAVPYSQNTPSAALTTVAPTTASITTPSTATRSDSPFFVTHPSPPLSATLPSMPYASSSPSLSSALFALPAQRQSSTDGISQQALSAWALQELGLGNAGEQTDLLSVPHRVGYSHVASTPTSDQRPFAEQFPFPPDNHDLRPSRPS